MKNASTPEKLQKLQKELEGAKAKSLQSPAFTKKVASLENARDIEIKKIQTLYNERIMALKKEAVNSVERKYQVVFDNFKNKSSKNVKNQYIIDLKRLEDKLIRQNKLAGALVVQTERNKSMGITAAAPAAKAAVPKVARKKAAPVKKAASVQKQRTKKAAAKLSATNPKSYRSNTKGLAGSGSNISNNIYAFDIQVFGNQSWLSFNGYGRKTNHSFGEVYLITPAGQRHQVASWSPEQLKASNYYGVKGANDVQAIKTNISQFIKSQGRYKVEFSYRDGNEPLTIYQVEIKTW
ncbi:MAG: hypothetical protein ABFS09_02380 [Thermodesulfobacteriota bacterium]